MSSTKHISISPKIRGGWPATNHDPTSAEKASKLLQEDLVKFDMFFEPPRHNHIVHHIIAAYALGASPGQLQRAFDVNAAYQRPCLPHNEDVIQAMSDKRKINTFLDAYQHYPSFLAFFQRQIDAKGPGAVLEEYLFANDHVSNELLVRWVAGLLHSVLHFGYAIETEQPAILAQALAQASIHEERDVDIIKLALLDAEATAASREPPLNRSLLDILDDIRQSVELEKAHVAPDFDKVKPVLYRKYDAYVKLLSEYTITPENLEDRILEAVNVWSAGAACKPPAGLSFKVDFFLLHAVNLVPFLPLFGDTSWLSVSSKIRLLEWITRYNILLYASRGCPELTDKYIEASQSHLKDWPEVFNAAINRTYDDGHLVKAVRALAFAQETTRALEKDGTRIIAEDKWLPLANMVLDSVKDNAKESEERWQYEHWE
ncbi:hypothetical protein CkaCkLH20_05305 [Colletotrichum karsti]|uniref:Oxidoreductase AflY n=1 Tax=Colletotrichum karsti TaxID=1095194 RepID=A0A9P6I6B1_9PEZI|nr:uncharacterized protein CkaCkLH20_05305 [Colletotrichum karsti]KAF9877039.1 hypothetical protein CkaCkLH20_05305 [Colletotrichum karsti]